MTRPTWLMRSLLAVALVPLALILVHARAALPAAPARATEEHLKDGALQERHLGRVAAG